MEAIIYWLGVITLSSAFVATTTFMLVISGKVFVWTREWLLTEWYLAKSLAIAFIISVDKDNKKFTYKGYEVTIKKGDQYQ